ncbi:hypothetical protein STAFG_7961 [Streptomyces afghaniensis 772]|uniref:Uncharacterized protein n=1 Tax=Streptomyces afghaniensis 772 TaxID=1283301 RepID=S4NAI1_9ACTN|nr:hypothetical protein STAFG_7961 [Streptomyces afghaniensis 772]
MISRFVVCVGVPRGQRDVRCLSQGRRTRCPSARHVRLAGYRCLRGASKSRVTPER